MLTPGSHDAAIILSQTSSLRTFRLHSPLCELVPLQRPATAARGASSLFRGISRWQVRRRTERSAGFRRRWPESPVKRVDPALAADIAACIVSRSSYEGHIIRVTDSVMEGRERDFVEAVCRVLEDPSQSTPSKCLAIDALVDVGNVHQPVLATIARHRVLSLLTDMIRKGRLLKGSQASVKEWQELAARAVIHWSSQHTGQHSSEAKRLHAAAADVRRGNKHAASAATRTLHQPRLQSVAPAVARSRDPGKSLAAAEQFVATRFLGSDDEMLETGRKHLRRLQHAANTALDNDDASLFERISRVTERVNSRLERRRTDLEVVPRSPDPITSVRSGRRAASTQSPMETAPVPPPPPPETHEAPNGGNTSSSSSPQEVSPPVNVVDDDSVVGVTPLALNSGITRRSDNVESVPRAPPSSLSSSSSSSPQRPRLPSAPSSARTPATRQMSGRPVSSPSDPFNDVKDPFHDVLLESFVRESAGDEPLALKPTVMSIRRSVTVPRQSSSPTSVIPGFVTVARKRSGPPKERPRPPPSLPSEPPLHALRTSLEAPKAEAKGAVMSPPAKRAPPVERFLLAPHGLPGAQELSSSTTSLCTRRKAADPFACWRNSDGTLAERSILKEVEAGNNQVERLKHIVKSKETELKTALAGIDSLKADMASLRLQIKRGKQGAERDLWQQEQQRAEALQRQLDSALKTVASQRREIHGLTDQYRDVKRDVDALRHIVHSEEVSRRRRRPTASSRNEEPTRFDETKTQRRDSCQTKEYRPRPTEKAPSSAPPHIFVRPRSKDTRSQPTFHKTRDDASMFHAYTGSTKPFLPKVVPELATRRSDMISLPDSRAPRSIKL